MPTEGQFHISNSAGFRSRVDEAEKTAAKHFSHSDYRWAQWTGDISDMFDEMHHDAILEAVWWALNSVATWTRNRTRTVDRLSVAKHGP